MASAAPASTTTDASARRGVSASPSSTTPISAASTGTHNCSVAAVDDASFGSTEYHTA